MKIKKIKVAKHGIFFKKSLPTAFGKNTIFFKWFMFTNTIFRKMSLKENKEENSFFSQCFIS
jgi:hypothetical protein